MSFDYYWKKKVAYENEPYDPNIVLFARSVSKKGALKFFWATTKEVFDVIKSQKDSHFLETIEPKNTVKLAIDIDHQLDYDVDNLTSNIITDNIVRSVVLDINKHLEEEYNITDVEVIILRSKLYKRKISLHIIYKNVIFENIVQLKYFMKNIQNTFVDQNIYRVGVFRCMNCSKYGKDNVLNLYKGIKYKKPESSYQLFLDTLLTYNKYTEKDNIHRINNVMEKIMLKDPEKLKFETRGRKKKVQDSEKFNSVDSYYYIMNEMDLVLIEEILDNTPKKYIEEYHLWILVSYAVKDYYLHVSNDDPVILNEYKNRIYKAWDDWCQQSDKYNEKKNKNKFDILHLDRIKIDFLLDFPKRFNFVDDLKVPQHEIIRYYNFDKLVFTPSKYNILNIDAFDLSGYEGMDGLLEDKIIKSKIIAIKSPTGTGKTQFLKKILSKYPELPVISIVSRVNLAYEQVSSLKTIDNFQTYRENIDSRKLIIQLDSLKWLSSLEVQELYEEDKNEDVVEDKFDFVKEGKYLKFEEGIVILDEVNSLLEYFRSSTLRNNRKKIFLLFITLLKNASKIICMDADLCDMNMKFLFDVIESKDHILIYNQYKNRLGVNCQVFESDKRMKLVLIEHIQNLKYFIASFDSKSYMIQLVDEIMDYIKSNNICDKDGVPIENKFKIYASGIGEDQIDTKEWEKSFVFFTPKVIYGVSYTYSQKNVFCFATKETLNALHINQQIQRCRNQSNLFIFCKDKKNFRKYESMEEVSENTNMMIDHYIDATEELRELYQNTKVIDPKNEVRFYRDIYNHVIYTNDILKSHTKEYLIQILKKYGYNISFIHEDEFEVNDSLYIDDNYDSDDEDIEIEEKKKKEEKSIIEDKSKETKSIEGESLKSEAVKTVATKTNASLFSTNMSNISSLTFYSGNSQTLDDYTKKYKKSSDYSKKNIMEHMKGLDISKSSIGNKKTLKKIDEILPENIKIEDKKEERKKRLIEIFKIDETNCNHIEKMMLENDSYVEQHLNYRNLIKSDEDFNETLLNQEFRELIEERIAFKTIKIKYVRQLMKELGLNSLSDIKLGNKTRYNEKIESEWILKNLIYIKDKIFYFRGEKYDIELINQDGGFKIVYFMLIHMIKNLCGPYIIDQKRTQGDVIKDNKITEFFLNTEYIKMNDEIIGKNTTKKENNKISLFTS